MSRNCLEQIHVLRRKIEAYYQCQLPVIAVFIDFQKTYESNKLQILINYGFSEKTVSAIATISSSSKSRVTLGESLIEAFQTITGFLQGTTLAPFIFIVILPLHPKTN